jgi:hypothetical protein
MDENPLLGRETIEVAEDCETKNIDYSPAIISVNVCVV